MQAPDPYPPPPVTLAPYPVVTPTLTATATQSIEATPETPTGITIVHFSAGPPSNSLLLPLAAAVFGLLTWTGMSRRLKGA